MKNYSEKELINGCLKNSRLHQREMYMLYFDSMYGMCLRHLPDDNTAMSVLNDGFLNVFKNLRQFRFEGNLESWIRKIIYNKIIDHYRKKSNSFHFIEFEDKEFSDTINENLDYEEILKLIKTLPENDQKVFILHTIEGYNHNEISEMMNISAGTSKWYLFNARKKLQNMIIKNRLKLNNY